MDPSDEPAARRSPNSWGAKEIELTEESWLRYSYSLFHVRGASSRQRITWEERKKDGRVKGGCTENGQFALIFQTKRSVT